MKTIRDEKTNRVIGEVHPVYPAGYRYTETPVYIGTDYYNQDHKSGKTEIEVINKIRADQPDEAVRAEAEDLARDHAALIAS